MKLGMRVNPQAGQDNQVGKVIVETIAIAVDCTQEGGQGVKSYLGLMILGRKLSRGQVPQTGVQPPFVV